MQIRIVIISLFCLVACAIAASAGAQDYGNCPNQWHPPPCGTPPQRVAVSPEMKNRAAIWSQVLNAGIIYLQPLIILQGAQCIVNGSDKNGDSCAWALMLAAAQRGLEIGKHWADAYVKDPFDEYYGYPYAPQFYDPVSQLGSPDCAQDGSWPRDLCAWANAQTQHIYAFWEAAYVSANRAQSCATVGNDDCFFWQKARMHWFIWAAGVHTGYLAYGLAITADVLSSADAAYAADSTNQAAQDMEAQYVDNL